MIMRFLKSYGIALAIIIVVGAWMATGVIVQGGKGPHNGERPVISLFEEQSQSANGEQHADPSNPDDPALSIAERNALKTSQEGPARSVRVQTFTAKVMPIEVPVRGRTKASAVVAASAETSGIVQKVDVAKGDRVAVGDLLCTLDKGTRAATLAQAQANLDKAQLDYDTNAKLREKGLAAANTASAYESGLKAAQAALDQAKTELSRTEIRARVAGIVQDPMAEEGAMLGIGAPCATIVELDPLLFVGSIPEARIGLARLGLPVAVTTVTGQTVEGKVTFISATSDPNTRTFEFEAELPNADGKIRDGLTAEAVVKAGATPAQLLPQSVLTLDDAGTLGVRAVDSDNKVVFYPITIAKDTADGVWVLGLPAKVDIITLGQENVKAGQTVAPGRADEGSSS